MQYIFHFAISTSLLYIGEFTTFLTLQTIFLLTQLFRKLIWILLIPITLFSLSKLFASTLYILYFFNLALFLMFLYKEKSVLFGMKYLLFTLYAMTLLYLYNFFELSIYELYLAFGVEDRVNHLDRLVMTLLTLLHLIILFIMGYNREKILRKY